MNSRREFVASVAGVAGALAVPASALGANDRIRIGVIGCGGQGTVDMRAALKCENTEVIGLADVFTKRLDDARKLAPNAKTYMDYRYLLDDKDVDAVIIATPQHLHCEGFVAAMEAGKHAYQEKTMAFTVEHAKKMRAAYLSARRTVQIGHQGCSAPELNDAASYVSNGSLGKITEVHAHMYRNTPHGEPQWTRPVTPDMSSENIIWKSFLGDARNQPFDANKYINWRFFWDFSGGNYYENMCHQLASTYKVLNLTIPESVTSTGGVFVWKDGREVPDTMCTSMTHSEELLYNWTSGFGNNELGGGQYILGTDGSIADGGKTRYIPQKVNRPDAPEVVFEHPPMAGNIYQAHMQNFLDCIRSGQETNCPFDLGFRVSIACRMAVDSYRQKRTLSWDPSKEEIV
ncbi:MAG: Gfo/Idh/MocA family oxidoreductase [Bryobacterales bacterium]|nr:Gfo/Idh/MocA family oxidoreductase [Bryobacterales bacterium]